MAVAISALAAFRGSADKRAGDRAGGAAAPPRPPTAAPCSVREHAPSVAINATRTSIFFIVVPLDFAAPMPTTRK
ncbi:MAG: hypothetical protein ABS57_18040 [Mesorhizobium sp. SCN 65-12]|nr:MAG: hypothetical protein ABS57_18040 [Mesorhizobium sp. SCN 65-12]